MAGALKPVDVSPKTDSKTRSTKSGDGLHVGYPVADGVVTCLGIACIAC